MIGEKWNLFSPSPASYRDSLHYLVSSHVRHADGVARSGDTLPTAQRRPGPRGRSPGKRQAARLLPPPSSVAAHGRGRPGSRAPELATPAPRYRRRRVLVAQPGFSPGCAREAPGRAADRGAEDAGRGRPGGFAPRAPGRRQPGPRFPSLRLPPPPALCPSPPFPSLPALPLLLPGHVSPFFVCSGNNFSPLGAPRPDAPRRRRAGGGTGRGERRGRREDALRAGRTPQVPCRAATPAPLPPAPAAAPRRPPPRARRAAPARP